MPEAASTRLGLVAPSSSDPIADGDNQLRALVAQLEAVGAGFKQGTSRPAASSAYQGYFYIHTGTSVVSYCTGSTWIDVGVTGSAYIQTLLDDADAAAAKSTLLLPADYGAMGLQAGVVAAGDLMVTQRAAGADMSVDYASGTVWVPDGSGGLVRVVVVGSNISAGVAASANSRVDQLVVDSAGTVSRKQGSEQSGATLDNAAGTTSRAALASNEVRLAEWVVGTATSSVTNSSIRSRRTFARGSYKPIVRTSGSYTISTTVATVDGTNIKPRLECTGNPMEFVISGRASVDAFFQIVMDGATYIMGASDGSSPFKLAAGTGGSFVHHYTPAAGSHTFEVYCETAPSGTGTLYATTGIPFEFKIIEQVRQNAASNDTTSG